MTNPLQNNTLQGICHINDQDIIYSYLMREKSLIVVVPVASS